MNGSTKRIRFLGATITALLIALAPAAAQAQQANEVRLGFLAPTTGVFAGLGALMVEGAILAMEEYGYEINGMPVRLIIEDTQLNGEIAVDKSRKLDQEDNVHIIIGPLSGGVGLSVHDWATGSGVPVIIAYSAPEDITMRRAVHNVTRNSWTGAQPMDPFGYWVATELGYKRIYVIGQDYSFPYNQIGGFKRGFCRGGGELVTNVWHPIPTEDFSSIIARIPRTGYDAVLYNGGGSDSAAFVNQYIDFGMMDVLPLLGQSNAFELDVLPAVSTEVVGAISAMQYVETLDTPEFIAFRDAYVARWGHLPATIAEHGYTGVIMALRAVAAVADVNDRPALIDALRATDYPDAPRGGFYLDEYANPVHNIYIREVREVDGELRNVGIFRVPAVSQFGPYDPAVYMAQPPDARDYPSDVCADMPAAMLDVEEVYEFIPMAPIN